MALRPTNKRNPNFNMSSLTDIIFLLLIFFMLTSTFITPNALNLTLPSSNSQATTKKDIISVSITKNLEYYVGTDKVTLEDISPLLAQKVANKEKETVVLNAEEGVPIEKVVEVMNIFNELKVEMILATRPLKE